MCCRHTFDMIRYSTINRPEDKVYECLRLGVTDLWFFLQVCLTSITALLVFCLDLSLFQGGRIPRSCSALVLLEDANFYIWVLPLVLLEIVIYAAPPDFTGVPCGSLRQLLPPMSQTDTFHRKHGTPKRRLKNDNRQFYGSFEQH